MEIKLYHRNLTSNYHQLFHSHPFIILIYYFRIIRFIIVRVEFLWLKIFRRENNCFYKDILIILLLWMGLIIGLLLCNRGSSLMLGFGLIINVFVAFNVPMRKYSRLGYHIKNILLWLDLILTKDKLFSSLISAKLKLPVNPC